MLHYKGNARRMKIRNHEAHLSNTTHLIELILVTFFQLKDYFENQPVWSYSESFLFSKRSYICFNEQAWGQKPKTWEFGICHNRRPYSFALFFIMVKHLSPEYDPHGYINLAFLVRCRDVNSAAKALEHTLTRFVSRISNANTDVIDKDSYLWSTGIYSALFA